MIRDCRKGHRRTSPRVTKENGILHRVSTIKRFLIHTSCDYYALLKLFDDGVLRQQSSLDLMNCILCHSLVTSLGLLVLLIAICHYTLVDCSNRVAGPTDYGNHLSP